MNEQISMLPLSALRPAKANVRKVPTPAEYRQELKSSIRYHKRILHNLLVEADPAGPGSADPDRGSDGYLVIDGEERRKARVELVEEGEFDANELVPCLVLLPDAEASAEEASLTVNTIRHGLHPADQYVAFARLHKLDLSVEEIAERFGVSAQTVEQRLRMGTLHATILKAYRNGEIDLEQMQAFTLTTSKKHQLEIWNQVQKLPRWGRGAHQIKEKITREKLSARSSMVRFVGLANDRKAGETVTEDLFSELDGQGTYVDDPVLLERLAQEKLEKYAKCLQKDGWKWVEISQDGLDYDEVERFDRFEMRSFNEPTAAEAERLDALETRIGEAIEADDEEAQEAAEKEHLELEEQIESRTAELTPEQKAQSGIVVSVGTNGKASRTEGLIRDEDRKAAAEAVGEVSTRKKAKAQRRRKDPEKEKMKQAGYSQAVNDDLKVIRNNIVRRALAERVDVAKDYFLFQLCRQVFDGEWSKDGLSFTASRTTLGPGRYGNASKETVSPFDACNPAGIAMQDRHEELAERHKDWLNRRAYKDLAKCWTLFFALEYDLKEQLWTHCISFLLHPQLSISVSRASVMEAVITEIAPDFGGVKWSEGVLWKRLPKAKLLEILEQIGGMKWADVHKGDKNGELAAYVEKVFADPSAEELGLTEKVQEKVKAWAPEEFAPNAKDQ